MDFTSFAQPTTVIGLAGLAIFSIVYVILQFDKSHKKAQALFVDLIEKKDEDYRNFVNSNNHQMTELVKESTKAITEASENIKASTKVIQQVMKNNISNVKRK